MCRAETRQLLSSGRPQMKISWEMADIRQKALNGFCRNARIHSPLGLIHTAELKSGEVWPAAPTGDAVPVVPAPIEPIPIAPATVQVLVSRAISLTASRKRGSLVRNGAGDSGQTTKSIFIGLAATDFIVSSVNSFRVCCKISRCPVCRYRNILLNQESSMIRLGGRGIDQSAGLQNRRQRPMPPPAWRHASRAAPGTPRPAATFTRAISNEMP